MRFLSVLAPVAALLFACGSPVPPPHLVLFNGRVMTMDANRPEATAIAVRGDSILAVGSDQEVLDGADGSTPRVDLNGSFVLPGLIDSHVHLRSLGQQLASIDLREVTSIEEIVRRVKAGAASAAPGEWVSGIGWDQNLWSEKSYPDHRRLSAAVPDSPVWLQRIDWYAAGPTARRWRRRASRGTRRTRKAEGSCTTRGVSRPEFSWAKR